MTMRKIVSWKARRSGAHMTIIGRTVEGQAVKVSGVASIESAKPWPIATDVNGERYQLAFDPVFSTPADVVADTANAMAV